MGTRFCFNGAVPTLAESTCARSGRRLDYERHTEFRNGTKGYNRRDGDRGAYREAFRNGFATGYNDAYRANARNRDGDDDRDGPRRR